MTSDLIKINRSKFNVNELNSITKDNFCIGYAGRRIKIKNTKGHTKKLTYNSVLKGVLDDKNISEIDRIQILSNLIKLNNAGKLETHLKGLKKWIIQLKSDYGKRQQTKLLNKTNKILEKLNQALASKTEQSNLPSINHFETLPFELIRHVFSFLNTEEYELDEFIDIMRIVYKSRKENKGIIDPKALAWVIDKYNVDYKTLRLSKNELEALIPYFHKLNLSSLNDIQLEKFLALTALEVSHDKQMDNTKLESILKVKTLTSLNLFACKINDEDLVHFNKLKYLTSLDLSHTDISDEGLKHLNALTHLTHLDLAYSKITNAGIVHLANLTNLTSLDLSGCKITNDGLAQLANLTNLTSLDLSKCYNFTDAGLSYITNLTNLASLNLWECKIGDVGLAYLMNLNRLTSLKCYSHRITNIGLNSITKLTKLNSLHLYSENISNNGLIYLSNLTSLTSLFLWSSKITNSGLIHLSNLVNLTYLDISSTRINEQGLIHLAKLTDLTALSMQLNKKQAKAGLINLTSLKNLSSLTLVSSTIPDTLFANLNLNSLNLYYCKISDISLAPLTNLQKFTSLNLYSCNFTKKSFFHITNITNLKKLCITQTSIYDANSFSKKIDNKALIILSKLKNLRSLNLASCKIDDASPLINLPNLAYLDISYTKIDKENFQRLVNKMPHTVIDWEPRS